MKHEPQFRAGDRSSTWWEGFWAAVMGWSLHSGATPPYEDGWRFAASRRDANGY